MHDPPWQTEDWGRMPYGPALDRQRLTNQAVIDGQRPPTVAFLEHDPVLTVSRRPGAADHVLASPQRLAELGIAVHDTDRGGDVTYHGPGQLIAYAFLRLKSLGLGLHDYMRWLEQAVIDAVAPQGVAAHRLDGCTGVWVTDPAHHDEPAKLAALGVRVRRGVTMHGVALNVAPDPTHFATIVPCGLTRPVTSLAALGVDTTVDAMKPALRDAMIALAATTERCTRKNN